MSLYAIGDLHLHFQSELKAPGQLYGKVWKDHESKFRENCERLIREEDTLVLVGDHSWGKKLKDCEKDLEYICALPGRKILLRGNHDMFWDVKKTEKLNALYRGRLSFLSAGMRPKLPGRKSWSDARSSGLRSLLRPQRQTVSESTSCSCTIRRPIYCRRTVRSPAWRRSMARARSSTGTAMGKSGSMTAFAE